RHLPAESGGPRWAGEGKARQAMIAHALRVGKVLLVGPGHRRGRAAGGSEGPRPPPAPCPQNGGGRCHSQGSRAPQVSVRTGLVVHRGLLIEPVMSSAWNRLNRRRKNTAPARVARAPDPISSQESPPPAAQSRAAG